MNLSRFGRAINSKRFPLQRHINKAHSFTSTSRTMSSNSNTNAAADTPNSATSSSKEAPLALPAADTATQIDVSKGQGTAKLDHLGPMVVNSDGTLSRITNWENMTEMEQKNTLRIISKRNKERIDALKKARGESEET